MAKGEILYPGLRIEKGEVELSFPGILKHILAADPMRLASSCILHNLREVTEE
jgi:hypothetical protein